MKSSVRWLLLSLAAIVLVACQRESGNDADTAAATAAAAVAAVTFATEQQAWRAERHERLLQPDGWASLIGLHWIGPGAHYVGSAQDNGIRLAMGPEQLGLLRLDDGQLHFTPAEGVELTLDGQPLVDTAALRSDVDEAGPSVIGFDGGDGATTAIVRDGRFALRVKHAQAPTRTGFAGLEYWPGGAEWKIDARFQPHPSGRTIPIASIVGTLDDTPNPGAVVFQRDGREYRIEALDDGSDELFLIFADRTSGHGSYPAGRYLYVPPPDAQGRLVVDFNRAYNPPCAFTAFATCPLPPPENRLDLAIDAGEKAYAESAH